MWFLKAPAAVVGLVAIALIPSASAKPYPVHLNGHEERQLYNSSQIAKRQCGGQLCGYDKQLCCPSGTTCFTDANNQAQCGNVGAANGNTQGWSFYTSTWVESNVMTHVTVYSSFVGATPAAQPTGTCGSSQQECGGRCCDSGFWCNANTVCELLGGGSSGGIIGTLTPSAPLRPTSSTLIIVTATGTPTATVPFETPIATGVSGTPVPVAGGGGGLSPGAIAGIVIGVLAGLALLALLCFCFCARGLLHSVMAIFGLGKNRKHTHEETYIEEHHHSSGAAGAGGRRWHGQGPARPARPEKKKTGGLGGLMAGAGLVGALAVALGLKRKADHRHDDKSTVSGTSYMYSDYTSTSSASSSDRHTRRTRHSSRR
ncbi:hypothetical protein BDV95DRAFT_599032 [Massariosphaeria phaeospora]|uniref:Mid2 domain-containing protein n=1 Tax=Massariosphaeria phaeospora TaxID=100035 RepID=A0A7C8HZL9_9PLEO|nr:hypothetical protein BDV95DRAFT_599032 [Massariosphaeria phaeospora]